MAKEEPPRRSEIVDAARRLVYTVGYERMTIQDILDDLHISKGAFYHYFRSKQDLLETLIGRMLDEGVQLLNAIANDPTLPALAKLQRFFADAGRWKTDQKDFLLSVLRVWYDDGNAIVREKILSAQVEQVGPLLAGIIRQGIAEGTMNTPFPDEAGALFLVLGQANQSAMVGWMLSAGPEAERLGRLERIMSVYEHTLERMLGAPPHSIQLVDRETLREWIVPAPAASQPPAAANGHRAGAPRKELQQ
jgi:AcrR family transcriptional regulator